MSKLNRKLSREVAMELLYQNEINPLNEELLENIEENKDLKEIDQRGLDLNYINSILKSSNEYREEIKNLIEKNLEGWKFDRISKVNLSILTIAIAEMEYMDDIPFKVSVNEALNLCEKFGDEKDKPFINGILDRIEKNRVKEEVLKA